MKWCEDEKGVNIVRTSTQEAQINQMDADMAQLLKSQQEMLSKQQEQIDRLTQLVEKDAARDNGVPARGRGSGPSFSRGRGGPKRGCFRCGMTGHFIRDCRQVPPGQQAGAEAGAQPPLNC